MHPGWVDTAAARRGLGDFYEKMKEKFRKPEEGADTVIWLGLSNAALAYDSGQYFQGLPLFWNLCMICSAAVQSTKQCFSIHSGIFRFGCWSDPSNLLQIFWWKKTINKKRRNDVTLTTPTTEDWDLIKEQQK